MRKTCMCVCMLLPLAAGILFCCGQTAENQLRIVSRATEKVIKGEKIMEYKPKGDEILLVHDGKRVLARCGKGDMVGSGNPAAVFVVGTAAQVDAEIARLGLETEIDNVKSAKAEVVK